MMKNIVLAFSAVVLLAAPSSARAVEPAAAPAAALGKLPLPDGPVVFLVEDVPAFEKALSGGIRKAVTGKLPESDPVGAAWRRTRVGSKLDSQWQLFASDIPLTWSQISALKPSAFGMTLLAAGDLEAVLVVRTALAQLPVPLPNGTQKTYKGYAYQLVTRGAGDDRNLERRMGLAWCRAGRHLFLATSERSLLAALDVQAGQGGFSSMVGGFAQLRLNLDAVRKDLYFKREFLFDEGTQGPATGILLAGLELEGNRLVEVRKGTGEGRAPGATWPVAQRNVRAAGWEPDGKRLWSAFWRAVLDPVPSPSDRPVAAVKVLPSFSEAAESRYLVDLRQPVSAGTDAGGEGEIPAWKDLIKTAAPDGFGWEVTRDGYPRFALRQPPAFDKGFVDLSIRTLSRRSGMTPKDDGGTLRVGPGLAGLAYKRKGGFLWVGLRGEDLTDCPEPSGTPDLVRWGYLNLSDASLEREAWRRAEGAFSPEYTRPFSDRILGLLGWAPSLETISSERKRSGDTFTERVTFTFSETAGAKKPSSPPAPAPAAPKK